VGDAKVTLAGEARQRRAAEARLILLADGRITHVAGEENAPIGTIITDGEEL